MGRREREIDLAAFGSEFIPPRRAPAVPIVPGDLAP